MGKTFKKFVKNRFEKKKFNIYKKKKNNILQGLEDEYENKEEDVPEVQNENGSHESK